MTSSYFFVFETDRLQVVICVLYNIIILSQIQRELPSGYHFKTKGNNSEIKELILVFLFGISS